MTITLSWKMGFEIELMAPPGRTRADLARRVARRWGGTVRPFFHPQSEPGAGGRPVFENLTPGFEVIDLEGRRLASFVDDLTLRHGLNRSAPPRPGWRRIVADDGRLLQLVIGHCDPTSTSPEGLAPLAALFGTELERHPSGMARVVDARGVSVAVGAPLPGERERPCEIVTAPIEADHARVLAELLEDARAEGFGVPLEGATHIHFDAAPLRSARVLARLVRILWAHGEALKALVGVNPNCVRLGRWPGALIDLVGGDAFAAFDWPRARAALRELELTKYCDFNIINIVRDNPSKPTFEVRVLPSVLWPRPILEAAALFEALLRECRDADPAAETPPTVATLIQVLPLSEPLRRVWADRAAALRPAPEPVAV